MEIFGTLGPSCADRETLREMFCAGMTGMRLNLSHTNLAESAGLIGEMRAAAEAAGVKRPLFLIDMQGPELRIGWFPGTLSLREGEECLLAENTAAPEKDVIPVPAALLEKVGPGQELLLDDGKINLRAERAEGGRVRARVVRGGVLAPQKSIAAPGIRTESPALTQRDRENIAVCGRFGVTGVMQPFVRGQQDLREVRSALDGAGAGGVKLYAKIENLSGVEKLPELLPLADEIVIARGDLGNAVPLWQLPGVQRRIAGACRAAGVPFMVVTQMLSSMETMKVPTRAEVSDIYCAGIQGASSVMLTGETAVGKNPAEAVSFLAKTALEAVRDRELLGGWD